MSCKGSSALTNKFTSVKVLERLSYEVGTIRGLSFLMLSRRKCRLLRVAAFSVTEKAYINFGRPVYPGPAEGWPGPEGQGQGQRKWP
jgi:hypothetical protein